MGVKVRVWAYRGSSVEQQLAVREGETQYFKRILERDPRYGYKWTAWRRTNEVPVYTSNGNDPACWSETGSGWVEQTGTYAPKVRLPKSA